MAYITTADAKAYLGIPVATTTDDTLISAIITSAQAMIDTMTRRTFEASSDTEQTFDAVADVDGLTLYIDQDLCAITTITNGDGTEVTSDQYVTEPRRTTPYYAIRLLASAGVAWTYTTDPENAITIEGRWAFSTSAPDDIVHWCKRLVAWLYRQKDTNADLDRPLLTGDGVAILPSALPEDIRSGLRYYARLV